MIHVNSCLIDFILKVRHKYFLKMHKLFYQTSENYNLKNLIVLKSCIF